MKIRSISLNNVRRFQGVSATISGIADGITTISAPNESGKSTFFDALHAVFFQSHTGQPQEIRSLQPHSKGPVRISVDIEDDAGKRFRIEKTYLTSRSAMITELATGRPVAQADEAEIWIRNLIGADGHGPAGLLWVRQGISGFGPEGSGSREKGERDKLREARQSLMSSVAGQIDNITGGRKMDQIMRSCEADLDELATKTGQPKAGGEWHKSLRIAEDLENEEKRLATQVGELGNALQEHARLRREQKADDDSGTRIRRSIDLDLAAKSLETARSHARSIEDLRRDRRLCDLETRSHLDAMTASRDSIARQKRLSDAVETTGTTMKGAAEDAENAIAHLRDTGGRLALARTGLARARSEMTAAQLALERQGRARRRADLASLLGKVEAYEKDGQRQAAILRNMRICQDDMDILTRLSAEIATAKTVRDALAATLRIDYTADRRVSLGGEDLPAGCEIPITRPLHLRLPGIGDLHLAPGSDGSGQTSASPEDIQHRLTEHLQKLGLATMEDARAELTRRNDAERALALAGQSVLALAPAGPGALAAELADQEDIAETQPQDNIDPEVLGAAVSLAEDADRKAQDDQDAARRSRDSAVDIATTAKARHDVACEAQAAHIDRSLPQEAFENLVSLHAQSQSKAAEIAASIGRLETAAPDVEAAEALVLRLTSARDNAERDRERRLERLNTLTGVIRARAEDGVETRIEEVRGQLEQAKSRAARYRFEVDALRELRDTLEAARKSARDAYFEPVKKEIAPLLAILHGDAGVEMDPDTMLPIRLTRDGACEDIETLSGGAAEQIAILTRLAFARLYARGGRQIPIILDDALVFCDDERITRMFTALTRSSKDQQIIVLSCRTRAFDDLGGTRVHIETAP